MAEQRIDHNMQRCFYTYAAQHNELAHQGDAG